MDSQCTIFAFKVCHWDIENSAVARGREADRVIKIGAGRKRKIIAEAGRNAGGEDREEVTLRVPPLYPTGLCPSSIMVAKLWT